MCLPYLEPKLGSVTCCITSWLKLSTPSNCQRCRCRCRCKRCNFVKDEDRDVGKNRPLLGWFCRSSWCWSGLCWGSSASLQSEMGSTLQNDTVKDRSRYLFCFTKAQGSNKQFFPTSTSFCWFPRQFSLGYSSFTIHDYKMLSLIMQQRWPLKDDTHATQQRNVLWHFKIPPCITYSCNVCYLDKTILLLRIVFLRFGQRPPRAWGLDGAT